MRLRFGSAFEEVDVHNMTRVQALAAIDAALRRAGSSVYSIRVIHGYHGGPCSGTRCADTTRPIRR